LEHGVSIARSSEPEPSAPIRLTVPAELRYLRLARVTAAAIAADLDYSMQDVDDVRVAVDELAALLIEDAGPGAELELCFAAGPDGITAEGHLTGGPTTAPSVHPVAAELLALVVDSYDVADGPGGRSFRFWKRSEEREG
jgi:serine/threonine-protein kinase RsbW